MAREGGKQHRSTKRGGETEAAPETDRTDDVTERKERLDEDVDAILDEIDEVLEENAEDFVRSFVQKGGQ
ncbi:MAG: ubiquitin-like protein Pup [Actinomycetota bacterium]|nr:ubiquitin-like protein Pup [Actinomycetota bacterium]